MHDETILTMYNNRNSLKRSAKVENTYDKENITTLLYTTNL